METALVRFDGGGSSFQHAVGRIAAVSPWLARAVLAGCSNGDTIGAFLDKALTVSFSSPADSRWWRSAVDWMRNQLSEFNINVCRPNAEDVFFVVAQRARGAAGGFDPGPTGHPRPIPPLPKAEPCDDDDGGHDHGHDHDHGQGDDDGWTGGGSECGSGCCGGGCKTKGGCGWIRLPKPGESPCIFDRPKMRAIDLRMACAQPGRANCEPISGRIAKCQIEEIVRATNRWFLTASTLDGSLVVVPPDAAHVVPAGFTMYAATLDPLQISHMLCLRNVTITLTTGTGAPVPVVTDQIGLEPVKLFCSPDGRYIDAYDWISWEDPDYIRITDGRCACAKLCVCVPWGVPVRVVFMIPTPAAGAVVTVMLRGKRECYGIMCGDCPPEAICGRTPVPAPVAPPPIVGLAAALQNQSLEFGDVLKALAVRFPEQSKSIQQLQKA